MKPGKQLLCRWMPQVFSNKSLPTGLEIPQQSIQEPEK
jgi:hypothetical protein